MNHNSILLSHVRIVIERFRGIVRDVAHFLPWLQLAATLESNRDGNDAALSVLQHVLIPKIGLRELAQLSTVLESTASPIAASHETGTRVSRINGEGVSANVSEIASYLAIAKGESLDAVSGVELSRLGTVGILSIRRSLRFS